MRRIAAFVTVVVMVAQLAIAIPAVGRAQEASSPGMPSELPATPVGDQLAWLIGVLSGREMPTEADVATHFTPTALVEIPPPMILGRAQQFAEAFGPFSYQGPARPATPNQIVGYLTGRDDVTFLVVVATQVAPPHQLTGVALLPVPPPSELPAVAPESLSGLFDVGGRSSSPVPARGVPPSFWKRVTGIVAACGRRSRTESLHAPASAAMTDLTSPRAPAILLQPRAPRQTRWQICMRCSPRLMSQGRTSSSRTRMVA